MRGGAIYLMTEDDFLVMQMVRHGLINRAQARHHADKNVIVRALGTHREVSVATWNKPFPAKPDDRFVLCTDGLYDLVEDEENKDAAQTETPRAACEKLIGTAKRRGSYDNVSVGLVTLQPAKPEAASITQTAGLDNVRQSRR